MTTELVKHQDITPMQLLDKAMSSGSDLAQIEKLMELQERHEKNEARKAFHVAMSDFKANPPKILKDSTVSYNQTSYKHATLANVTNTINSELSKHGLSATWKTKQENIISVTCCITHIFGHQECTTLSAPADGSGKKNPIQAIGSTVTYLQRYTLLALTGLATQDQDDDGQGSGDAEPKLMTKAQAEIIKKECDIQGIDAKEFAEAFGISRKESTEEDAARFIKTIYSKIKQFMGEPE